MAVMRHIFAALVTISYTVVVQVASTEGANVSRSNTRGICDRVDNVDCHGNDLKNVGKVTHHTQCCEACQAVAGCNAWTWDWKNTGNCYLKSACSDRQGSDSCDSGYGPSPAPGPPSPPKPPTPTPPPAGLQLQVVSYNLYWWCVSDEYGNCPQFANGKGFSMLYDRIKQNGPFDLIGFQECDNVAQVIGGAGLSGRFSFYAAPGDGPMAWDNQKYAQIGGPGQVWVAKDQYGDRFMNWVRLRVQASGQTIFFANTHGPLNGCGNDLGSRYISGVNSNKQPTDTVVLTGDFNCGSDTATIKTLAGAFENDATGDSYGGADHIFSSFGVKVQWQGHVNGAPSDHSLLKAVLGVTAATDDSTEMIVV